MATRFNCGEYLPGQEPISIPGLCPPAPVILIPEPPQPEVPQLPTYPGNPRPPRNPIPRPPDNLIPPSIPGEEIKPPRVIKEDGIDIRIIEIDREVLNRNPRVIIESQTTPGPTLYNPSANLSQVKVPTNATTLVFNSNYRNIFKDQIAFEVDYLLQRQNSISEWSEFPIQELTLSKLELSLREDLLTAFKTIHNLGGQLVGKNSFLESLRKHIITGKINEFDSTYYIRLSNEQKNDQRLKYQKSLVEEYNERGALGILASEAKTLDTSRLTSIQKNQLKRYKALNEDVNAEIPICSVSGEIDLEVFNYGIDLCLDGSSSLITDGPGDGYYTLLNSVDYGCNSISYTTNVPNSYYPCQETRLNALSLMGEDPSITIVASTSSNEFDDSSIPNFNPVILIPDFNSIQSYNPNNPLVENTSTTYYIETNEEVIQEYLNNNGFGTTRINLDFRDPMYKYIKDTSSLTLIQNDITFQSFQDNLSVAGNNSIGRTVPRAIVLTPVSGTSNNPFNGFSRLQSFDSSSAVRSIKLVNDINFSNRSPTNISVLEQVNLFNETGLMAVGSIEPNDLQSITYVFNPSSSNLSGTFEGVSSYGASYLVKEVIDNIIETHDPESITWFDVYRRMPLNKFGELMYDMNHELITKLSKGFRDIKISHVLNSLKGSANPLLEEDDMVVR